MTRKILTVLLIGTLPMLAGCGATGAWNAGAY